MKAFEARNLLGLSNVYTAQELKQAWRSAMSKAHPDKGGSVKLSQNLNNAYEVLSKLSIVEVAQQSQDNYSQVASMVDDLIFSAMDTEAFESHLSKIFGVKVTLSKTLKVPANFSASMKLTFSSADLLTLIDISFSVQYMEVREKHMTLGADTTPTFPVATHITMFHNGYDIKPSRSRYKKGAYVSDAIDPSVLFDESKIKKIIQRKADNKPVRQDYVTFFTYIALIYGSGNEFRKSVESGGNKYQLLFSRITWPGRFRQSSQSHWQLNLWINRQPALVGTVLYEDGESDFIGFMKSVLNMVNSDPSLWESASKALIKTCDDCTQSVLGAA